MARDLLKPVTVHNAKPSNKDQRLNDGGGLYLLVKINGAKWWRFDYTFNKNQKNWHFKDLSGCELAFLRRQSNDLD